jgi:hypothetical protein
VRLSPARGLSASIYEDFWNRLNASWEFDFPIGKAQVKVLSVTRARKPAKEPGRANVIVQLKVCSDSGP